MPDPIGARRDFLEAPSRCNAVGLVIADCRGFAKARVFVGFLDEQPALASVLPAAASDQIPAAVKLLSSELELETALVEHFLRIALRHPCAAVPQHHGSRA